MQDDIKTATIIMRQSCLITAVIAGSFILHENGDFESLFCFQPLCHLLNLYPIKFRSLTESWFLVHS